MRRWGAGRRGQEERIGGWERRTKEEGEQKQEWRKREEKEVQGEGGDGAGRGGASHPSQREN